MRSRLVAATLLLLPTPVFAQATAYSPARVRVEDADVHRAASVQELLEGRVAGVEVIDDPTPAGGVTIRIRGGASTMNSEPLYVLDGMPLNFGAGITAGSNPLDFIDVADVESVTVIKDAAGTAAYGARGAHGVVLIETRRTAPARLSYAGSIAASAALGGPDLLDEGAFRVAVGDYAAEFGPDYSGELGDADTDWIDELERTGIGHDHSIAYAGGGEDLDYRLSVGYANRPGVVNRSSGERATVGFGYAQDFADDRIHLRASLRGSHANDDFVLPYVRASAYAMAPTQPVRDEGSPYGGFFEWDTPVGSYNPVALLELTDDEGTTRRGFGLIEAELDIATRHPLSVSFRMGRDGSSFERDASHAPELRFQTLGPDPGYTSRLEGEMSNSIFGAWLTHERPLGPVALDLVAGWSTEQFDLDAEHRDAQGDPPSSTSEWSIELDGELSSLFARAQLALSERYVLALGIRSDGNDDERFTYPSASVAWHLGEEPFMAGAPVGALTLRGSFGRSGSIEITRVLFPSAYDIGRTTSAYQFGGLSPLFIGVDPELEPEEVTALDVGLDAATTGGRLRGSLDLYSRTTGNVWGDPGAVTNVGTLVNRGIELSIDALVSRGDDDGIEWRAAFVASRNSSEITELDGPIYFTRFVNGALFSFIQVVDEDVAPHAFYVFQHRSDNPGFGDIDDDGDVDGNDLYVDRNDDGIITLSDARAHQSPAPRWIFGHTSRLRWRTMDAAFGLRAQLGNHVYNNVASTHGHLSALGASGAPSNLHESVNETGFTTPQLMSEYYVEDASFLRMDHVTLGWTPGGGDVRLFASVLNAFTLTEYRGADPEVGPSGIDYYSYPRARTVMAGANVRF